MKRYNINWYNGWKIMIDLVYIPLLIICVPFVWTIICVWWLIFSDNMAIPTLACAILAVAVIVTTLYFGLANHFYNAANSVVNNYGGGNMRCSVPGRLFAQCCALWR